VDLVRASRCGQGQFDGQARARARRGFQRELAPQQLRPFLSSPRCRAVRDASTVPPQTLRRRPRPGCVNVRRRSRAERWPPSRRRSGPRWSTPLGNAERGGFKLRGQSPGDGECLNSRAPCLPGVTLDVPVSAVSRPRSSSICGRRSTDSWRTRSINSLIKPSASFIASTSVRAGWNPFRGRV
jgi:hypothetical protein